MYTLPGNPSGCDSDRPASHDGQGGCHCIVCGRCGRHTGNSNQGHYWAYCNVTHTKREFHFCCPDNCELEAKKIELADTCAAAIAQERWWEE